MAAVESDLQNVLAPMTLRGFADGFGASSADIGALAMVQLADGTRPLPQNLLAAIDAGLEG